MDTGTPGFTAWLTTQTSMTLNGRDCEVNVSENEPTGGREPMRATRLPVAAGPDTDDGAAQAAAESRLTKAGWEITGDWEQYDHGYLVAVRRQPAGVDHRQTTREMADRERGQVRCAGCGRKPLEFPYYEGVRSGASLCGSCADQTTSEPVRRIG